MKVLNYTAKNINQGGKRNGSIAVYIEPWHDDIREFLDTKKPQGSDDMLCRDLFIALFINDLFMKRVKEDSTWSLMNPDVCVGLTESYGDSFDKLYENYEKENKFTKQIKARDLWNVILKTQIESGMPYMIYKDQVNKLSNQSNLGTIKSSNLCIEITEYSNKDEYAVCNLASIALSSFVKPYENNVNNKWIIYTKPYCKYCNYTKKYLQSLNIPFEEVEFNSDNLEKLKTLVNPNNKLTFPQIFLKRFIDNQIILNFLI
jgi:ribonucleotide reductase alpha subunit